MNKIVLSTVTFISGLAIGAFVMKKYFDSSYEVYEVPTDETIITDNEDIEEHPTKDDKQCKWGIDKIVELHNGPVDKARKEYHKILTNQGYQPTTDEYDDTPPVEEDWAMPINRDVPYNIPPEEHMAIDGYDSGDFTVYADGYVTDSAGMPVNEDDVESMLGYNFQQYFGTYSDDEIWMRNDRLKMDFSIARDIDNFADVAPTRIKRLVGLE